MNHLDHHHINKRKLAINIIFDMEESLIEFQTSYLIKYINAPELVTQIHIKSSIPCQNENYTIICKKLCLILKTMKNLIRFRMDIIIDKILQVNVFPSFQQIFKVLQRLPNLSQESIIFNCDVLIDDYAENLTNRSFFTFYNDFFNKNKIITLKCISLTLYHSIQAYKDIFKILSNTNTLNSISLTIEKLTNDHIEIADDMLKLKNLTAVELKLNNFEMITKVPLKHLLRIIALLTSKSITINLTSNHKYDNNSSFLCILLYTLGTNTHIEELNLDFTNTYISADSSKRSLSKLNGSSNPKGSL